MDRTTSARPPGEGLYGYVYAAPALIKSLIHMTYYPELHIISALDKETMAARVNEAFGKTMLLLTKNESISWVESEGEANEGRAMAELLPLLFLAIALLTMVTTMHRVTAKERVQIGTLKALGFRDGAIARHYALFGFSIGVLGSALGVALGYGIARFIMSPNGMMGTYFVMPRWDIVLPWWCLLGLAVMLAAVTLVSWLSVRRVLRGVPAEMLRTDQVIRVKPLAMEKGRLWQRFGFGTRWNLRDIVRHRNRTLMSVLGTTGCVVMMVAALGMSDTVDVFMDKYYGGAMNYQSAVYMADDASAAERREAVEALSGDWSSSISVEMAGEAVSLDVVSTPHGSLRFFDSLDGFVTLGDDGAYICQRIADERGLKPGDSFTVSPYGQEEQYTLTVAGVIRSLTKCVTVTDACAGRLGIEAEPAVIYTQVKKAEVPAALNVKNAQDHQAIVDSFESFMQIMNFMIVVLMVASAALALIVLYNLGIMSYLERYREMATLKVLGFRDRAIARLLVSQNLWLTVLGILIGMPLGKATLVLLMENLAAEYEMIPVIRVSSYALAALVTAAVALAVSAIVAARNRQIDMVESLKSAE